MLVKTLLSYSQCQDIAYARLRCASQIIDTRLQQTTNVTIEPEPSSDTYYEEVKCYGPTGDNCGCI